MSKIGISHLYIIKLLKEPCLPWWRHTLSEYSCLACSQPESLLEKYIFVSCILIGNKLIKGTTPRKKVTVLTMKGYNKILIDQHFLCKIYLYGILK